MFRLLIKRFVKDSDNTKAPDTIFAYALLCGIVGIALNLILFAGKFVAGQMSGSLAISADGFNNLSDAVVTLAEVMGFWIASYGAGEKHPFGHGRFEWIAGLFASLLVLFVGFQLVLTSVGEIRNPEPIEFSLIIAIILVVSIAIKLYMYLYNRKIGNLVNSVSLKATAADCLGDMVATSAVLVASLIQFYTGWLIDGWCGLVVSVLIIRAGIQALSGVLKRIVGQRPDQEFLDNIETELAQAPAIEQHHDLMVHDYGFGRYIVTMRCAAAKDKAAELDAAINHITYHMYEEGYGCVIQPEYIVDNPELTETLESELTDVLSVRGNTYLRVKNIRICETLTGEHFLWVDLIMPVTIKHHQKEIVSQLLAKVAETDDSIKVFVNALAYDDFSPHFKKRGD